jgi:hypothetical protein
MLINLVQGQVVSNHRINFNFSVQISIHIAGQLAAPLNSRPNAAPHSSGNQHHAFTLRNKNEMSLVKNKRQSSAFAGPSRTESFYRD